MTTLRAGKTATGTKTHLLQGHLIRRRAAHPEFTEVSLCGMVIELHAVTWADVDSDSWCRRCNDIASGFGHSHDGSPIGDTP